MTFIINKSVPGDLSYQLWSFNLRLKGLGSAKPAVCTSVCLMSLTPRVYLIMYKVSYRLVMLKSIKAFIQAAYIIAHNICFHLINFTFWYSLGL